MKTPVAQTLEDILDAIDEDHKRDWVYLTMNHKCRFALMVLCDGMHHKEVAELFCRGYQPWSRM